MSDEGSKKKRSYKRKLSNFLIYPRFQLSLLAINLLILFGCLAVLLYQMVTSWEVFNAFAIQENLIHNQNFLELMARQQKDFLMTVWFSAIVSCLVCAIFTVVFSHKILGPMHRLKTYFEDVAKNGHHTNLSFRDGDLNKEVPEIVNAAISRIKEDCETIDRKAN